MFDSWLAQPAVQFTTIGCVDVALAGSHAGDLAAGALALGAGAALDKDVEHFGLLMEVDAIGIGAAGVSPHDGVVADRAAGRMVEGAEDRVSGVGADIERWGELLDLGRRDHRRVDALQLVDLGPPVHRPQRRVGVGEGEVAAFAEHHVEVQVVRHRVVEVEAAVVERHAFRRQIVRAHDGGVPARPAAAEVLLVDDRNVGDAMVRCEVVRRGESVDTAADDHHVVGALELRLTPDPRPRLFPETPPEQPDRGVLGRWFVLPHRLSLPDPLMRVKEEFGEIDIICA